MPVRHFSIKPTKHRHATLKLVKSLVQPMCQHVDERNKFEAASSGHEPGAALFCHGGCRWSMPGLEARSHARLKALTQKPQSSLRNPLDRNGLDQRCDKKFVVWSFCLTSILFLARRGHRSVRKPAIPIRYR